MQASLGAPSLGHVSPSSPSLTASERHVAFGAGSHSADTRASANRIVGPHNAYGNRIRWDLMAPCGRMHTGVAVGGRRMRWYGGGGGKGKHSARNTAHIVGTDPATRAGLFSPSLWAMPPCFCSPATGSTCTLSTSAPREASGSATCAETRPSSVDQDVRTQASHGNMAHKHIHVHAIHPRPPHPRRPRHRHNHEGHHLSHPARLHRAPLSTAPRACCAHQSCRKQLQHAGSGIDELVCPRHTQPAPLAIVHVLVRRPDAPASRCSGHLCQNSRTFAPAVTAAQVHANELQHVEDL